MTIFDLLFIFLKIAMEKTQKSLQREYLKVYSIEIKVGQMVLELLTKTLLWAASYAGRTSFHLLCCLYGWMSEISSTSNGKPLLSNENAMTDCRQTWYVDSGGAQVLPTWSVVTECA